MPEVPGPPGMIMVDDNRLAAEAMERWIGRTATLRWLGWTDEASAVVPMVARLRPALVLLDVEMPGFDSFEILRRLTSECPDARVVMFSGHTRPALIGRALDEGAAGYIVKDEQLAVVADLLARAARGDLVLSPSAAAAYVRPGTHAD